MLSANDLCGVLRRRVPPSFGMPKFEDTTHQLYPTKRTMASVDRVRFQTRCMLMIREQSYEELLQNIRQDFKMDSSRSLRLLASVAEATGEQNIEVEENTWAIHQAGVKTIKVEIVDDVATPAVSGATTAAHEFAPNGTLGATFATAERSLISAPVTSPAAATTPQAVPVVSLAPAKLNLKTITPCGRLYKVRVSPTQAFAKTLRRVADVVGINEADIRWWANDQRSAYKHTPQDLGLADGDELHMAIEQRGGKPLIYLHSPQEMDVSVKLGLVPQWKFSALYLSTPITTSAKSGERVEWKVRAQPNGIMRDHASAVDVAYLFWEAGTDTTVRPMSPPSSPRLMADGLTSSSIPAGHFVPTTSDCTPLDSVLHFDAVPQYLDRALLDLGPHAEARTSFITYRYWLPSIFKYTHMALGFVNREVYERSAPLDITPRPDVMTRVFMLFQGVKASHLDAWNAAMQRTTEDVTLWRGVVGVPDETRQKDVALFRVLEWGGMEVI